jgi:hypothetical protein
VARNDAEGAPMKKEFEELVARIEEVQKQLRPL